MVEDINEQTGGGAITASPSDQPPGGEPPDAEPRGVRDESSAAHGPGPGDRPARAGDEPGAAEDAARGRRLLSAAERAALARLRAGEPLTPRERVVLDRLAAELRAPLPGNEGDPQPPADLPGAGFTHRYECGGSGFAPGGVLDAMPAGAALAVSADRAWQAGLGELSDEELAGLIWAQRRLASRAAAGELAAVGELAARRAAPDGSPGEHLEDEVAALLTLTGRAAAKHVALAAAMTRLPPVAAALGAGRIDLDKARVFAAELLVVDDDLAAAAVAAAVLGDAHRQTTSELGGELRAQIALFDAAAAARRKDKARKNARADVWIDPDGTGALAARGLDPADAICADQNLDTAARWLKAHGAPGDLDQLRAEALTARLTGRSLSDLLPPPPGPPNPAAPPATSPAPAGPPPGWDQAAPGHPATAHPGGPGWPGGLGGTVNLTLPLATWLGLSEAPGQASGYGTLDAATSRDLAARLTGASPATRWCLTLADHHGRAAAHGCARAGPGPPGADPAAWLATVTITPIATRTCDHRHQSAGYQPAPPLRHLIKIRSPRCGYPGCRNPATRCDDDHTIPHHRGGRTCECNLHPLCRRHHRAKQAQGWRLAQPEPGVLTWTLPCGPQITVTPQRYPV